MEYLLHMFPSLARLSAQAISAHLQLISPMYHLDYLELEVGFGCFGWSSSPCLYLYVYAKMLRWTFGLDLNNWHHPSFSYWWFHLLV